MILKQQYYEPLEKNHTIGSISIGDHTFNPDDEYDFPIQAYKISKKNDLMGVALSSLKVANGLLRLGVSHNANSTSYYYEKNDSSRYNNSDIFISLDKATVEVKLRRERSDSEEITRKRNRELFLDRLGRLNLGIINV